MKILVIDDAEVNRLSAQQLFADHDLMVCGSHDEALKLLEPQYDLREELFDGKSREETRLPYWDAVLCDLLMPAGRKTQGSKGMQYVGQEMPVGWSLALNAVTRGAKFVVVATDMNHHDHPASAMLDWIQRDVFTINDAKMQFTNRVWHVGIIGTEQVCPDCTNGRAVSKWHDREYECTSCRGTGHNHREYGKDWKQVLDRCMGLPPASEGAG